MYFTLWVTWWIVINLDLGDVPASNIKHDETSLQDNRGRN